MRTLCSLLLLAVSVVSASCSLGAQAVDFVYTQPVDTGDGWRTGTLAEAGVDGELIGEAVERILDGTYERVHSLLIVKDGRLVLDEYFTGSVYYHPTSWSGTEIQFDEARVHNLASLTKSVTSVLAGAAIQRGFIQDVSQSALSFFPRYADLRTPEKDRITIEHLLTMTSGWDWDENTEWVSENDMYQFNTAGDPLRYLIEQDLRAEPGTAWNYNGGAVTLLGKIIEMASGEDLDDFADRYIFGPLGIERRGWPQIQYNLIGAHGDLKLRPRDVAKIGQLMLQDGVWNDERLLPKGWVETSIAPSYAFGPSEGFYDYTDYGYLWWLMPYAVAGVEYSSYTAAGWGGQRMIIIPDLDAIVVFTGGNYAHYEPVDEIMGRYILPALAGP